MNKEECFVFDSWFENVFGSLLLGIGIGLYKRIANSQRPAAPRYCTVHIFFMSVLALTVSPYLKFPSVANQIRTMHESDFIDGKIDPMIEASYYQNRGSELMFFFLNGVLLTIVIFAIANALQHPGLTESSLNCYFTFITVVSSFSFDNWVLLRRKEVMFFTRGVVGLILALLAAYFLLQSYKKKTVKDRV